MDEIVYTIIVAIIVAIIGAVIGWTKRAGWDTKFENIYIKYKLVFDVSGTLIKAYDEQLYNELAELLTKMKLAYESPEFTADEFNAIVKEGQDVIDRVEDLLARHRGETKPATTDSTTDTKTE